MNEESSRSHAICTIMVTSVPASPLAGSAVPAAATLTSKIHLVDLAGSERLRQRLKKGENTLETRQINKGLHALSNVISALSSPAAASPGANHVPYRDSKLTRLLQDSLGGSARTLIIACVSPVDDSIQESLSTLQYAARARRIENNVLRSGRLHAHGGVPGIAEEVEVLQWQLLKRHLAHARLLPIPDVLLQVHLQPYSLAACCSVTV